MGEGKGKGQPTKYNESILAIANGYIDNYNIKYDHAIPSVAGLAVILKVCRTTIYNWSNQPENTDFLYTLSRIATSQEFKLLNDGLNGGFNPQITKLVLVNHGYSDKTEPQDTADMAEVLSKLIDKLPS